VLLEIRQSDGSHREIGRGVTDLDGRIKSLVASPRTSTPPSRPGSRPPPAPLGRGTYRVTFQTLAYFAQLGIEPYYPEVVITFELRDPSQANHIPLLLSPYGYTTHRGL